MTAPIYYRWTGTEMVPWRRFEKTCDREFVVGLDYRMEVVEDRSMASHDHFFALVSDAWKNIPEMHGNRWLEPDDLRKWALIQAGFCTETSFPCNTKAEAVRWVEYLRSIDSQCEIEIRGHIVVRKVAKSQSMKAMGKKEFQASKDAVLEVLGKLIGVPVEELTNQAGKAA